MLIIQIIALIVFVIGVVIIPIIDQLFFYRAFSFKGSSKATFEKGESNFKENEATETLEKESNNRIDVTRTTIERQATQEDFDSLNEPDINLFKEVSEKEQKKRRI